MRDLPLELPSRTDVHFAWAQLVAGAASREETAQWARVRMLAHYDNKPEMLVMSAIQTLDGFDLSYGNQRNVVGRVSPVGHRTYYHTDEHIKEEFQRWLTKLAAFDADPVSFMDDITTKRHHRHPDHGTTGG